MADDKKDDKKDSTGTNQPTNPSAADNDVKPNTDINDTRSDSNAERINQGEAPKIAYRDPETGETKERDAVADGEPAAVVFPEPTGTDGPR